MPFLKVGDIRMYYEVEGEGEPLVLIEGFTRNRLMWEPFIPVLSKQYRVVTFDNRGSGQTDDPPGAYTMAQMAQDTVGLMDALEIDQAYILGHSMGGSIVQQICLDFPRKIKKAMICTSTSKYSSKMLLRIDTVALFRKTGVSKELIIKSSLPWVFSNAALSSQEKIASLTQMLLDDPYPQSLAGYLGQAEALKSFDVTDRLHEIKIPILLIAGDEDIATPLSNLQVLAAKLPHAALTILKGQAHMIFDEKPEMMISHILSFFQ